jgi:putative nucleotidyltransferase with HDIG domain
MQTDKPLLVQRNHITNTILHDSGTKYMPIIVEAFLSVSKIEAFWLTIDYERTKEVVIRALEHDYRITTVNELFHIGKLFISAIDYRSRFTAAHSIGVSKVSRKIAELAGLSHNTQALIEVSGYFHDIGKVSISKEILDKPSKLSIEEFNLIKGHSFYTYEILRKVDGFETIAQIAAFHHERLDGTGYPYHIKGVDLIDYARLVYSPYRRSAISRFNQ